MSETKHIDIERLKKGDNKEFSLLIDLHAEKVFNLLRGLLRNETEAEDLTQYVFTFEMPCSVEWGIFFVSKLASCEMRNLVF